MADSNVFVRKSLHQLGSVTSKYASNQNNKIGGGLESGEATPMQQMATMPAGIMKNDPNQKNLSKAATHVEIVSAMVRLNNQGLSVPFKIEDFKKLPKIPNTGARVMKKKNITDLGAGKNMISIDEESYAG